MKSWGSGPFETIWGPISSPPARATTPIREKRSPGDHQVRHRHEGFLGFDSWLGPSWVMGLQEGTSVRSVFAAAASTVHPEALFSPAHHGRQQEYMGRAVLPPHSAVGTLRDNAIGGFDRGTDAERPPESPMEAVHPWAPRYRSRAVWRFPSEANAAPSSVPRSLAGRPVSAVRISANKKGRIRVCRDLSAA